MKSDPNENFVAKLDEVYTLYWVLPPMSEILKEKDRAQSLS